MNAQQQLIIAQHQAGTCTSGRSCDCADQVRDLADQGTSKISYVKAPKINYVKAPKISSDSGRRALVRGESINLRTGIIG